MPDKVQDDDALAREVDRLLRKLPGADPYLKGDPLPATGSGVAIKSGMPSLERSRAALSATRVQRIGVWVRFSLGALLGILIPQWPYQSNCGLGLSLYLFSVVLVIVAGVWTIIWTWRYRLPTAHVAALAVIMWGAMLVANPVLQRTGYAAVQATWGCGK